MRRRGKLVLHIGMPKTGTTALQAMMFDNGEVLNEYGYCYLRFQKQFERLYLFSANMKKNGRFFFDKDGMISCMHFSSPCF